MKIVFLARNEWLTRPSLHNHQTLNLHSSRFRGPNLHNYFVFSWAKTLVNWLAAIHLKICRALLLQFEDRKEKWGCSTFGPRVKTILTDGHCGEEPRYIHIGVYVCINLAFGQLKLYSSGIKKILIPGCSTVWYSIKGTRSRVLPIQTSNLFSFKIFLSPFFS